MAHHIASHVKSLPVKYTKLVYAKRISTLFLWVEFILHPKISNIFLEKTDFKTSQVVLLPKYVCIVRTSYLLHIFFKIYFMYVFSLEVTMRLKSLLKVWITIHVVAFACGKIRNKKNLSLVDHFW